MKLIAKIAVLTMLIAFVSSCQKEALPTPKGWSSQDANSSGSSMRTQNSPTSDTIPNHSILQQGDDNAGTGEIVGGGDDDRDGGGGEKKPKKGQ